jgi:hypothetical protein
MKKTGIIELCNDRYFIIGLISALSFAIIIIFQGVSIGILNNTNIIKSIIYFALIKNEYIIIVIILFLCFLRSIYFIISFIDSREIDGKILKILTNTTWKEYNLLDLNHEYEIIGNIATENNRIKKYIMRQSNIVGIEYKYEIYGRNYIKKQYFWQITIKDLLNISQNDTIKIIVNNRNKWISFIRN